MIYTPEYPGKMIGGMIADTFGNFADTHRSVGQVVFGLGKPELPDQLGEGVSGVLFYLCAQMGLTVMKQFC